jgi:hypothetical protein
MPLELIQRRKRRIKTGQNARWEGDEVSQAKNGAGRLRGRASRRLLVTGDLATLVAIVAAQPRPWQMAWYG